MNTDDVYPSSFRRDRNLNDPCSLPPRFLAAEPEESDQLYRDLLESAADGIYGLDPHGYVTFMNPAARRMTGWTNEDLRGRTQHSMVHHSHPDGRVYPCETCPIYSSLHDGRVYRREGEVFWRKDGSSFPVAYVSSPIFKHGKPAGAVVIFQDRSETQKQQQ